MKIAQSILVVAALSVILSCGNADAALLLVENAETFPTNDRWTMNGLQPNGLEWGKVPPNQDYIVVSSEQAREGNSSFKFYLGPRTSGVFNSYDQHARLVLQASIGSNGKYLRYGVVYWIGLSIYYPVTWTPTDATAWLSVFGFHGSPDAPVGTCDTCCDMWRNGVLDWQHKRDVANIIHFPKIRAQSVACQNQRIYDRSVDFDTQFPSIATGQWHDIVLHFQLEHTNSSAGFFNMWENGALVVTDSGINAFNDNNGPSFHIGMYSNDETTARYIYIDAIRIGGPNSSYDEVKPQGGSPPVDTEPPVLSNGYVAGASNGTLPSDTTSATIYVTSSETAAVRYSHVADTPWSSMTAVDGNSGLNYYVARSGLSNGSSYETCFRAQDAATNESAEHCVFYQVGTGKTNLLNSSNYVTNSDTNTYIDCYQRGNLWNGAVSGVGCDIATGGTGITSIIVENALNQEYNIDTIAVAGNNDGSLTCDTFDFLYKVNEGDNWILLLDDVSCTSSDLVEQSIDVNARFVRAEFTDAIGLQVREYQVYGTVNTGGSASKNAITGAYGGDDAKSGGYSRYGSVVKP